VIKLGGYEVVCVFSSAVQYHFSFSVGFRLWQQNISAHEWILKLYVKHGFWNWFKKYENLAAETVTLNQ